MLRFTTELDGEHLVREAAVSFCEALARLNARQFVREPKEASPCCARCGGCELDTSAPLADAKRMLAAVKAHPASVVAYTMGRELAAGVPCRVVLLDGDRLALERQGGELIDPLQKFETKEECCCHGQASKHGDPTPALAGSSPVGRDASEAG
ncbi:hypothetical protein ACNOYE_34775 [Nannocystaceae bacterium ST9]